MINRQKADRSINQLLSCVLGKARTKASRHLEDQPAERIEFCFKMIQREIQEILDKSEASELSTALYVSRMHLDSLNSLKTLNQLIQEVEW